MIIYFLTPIRRINSPSSTSPPTSSPITSLLPTLWMVVEVDPMPAPQNEVKGQRVLVLSLSGPSGAPRCLWTHSAPEPVTSYPSLHPTPPLINPSTTEPSPSHPTSPCCHSGACACVCWRARLEWSGVGRPLSERVIGRPVAQSGETWKWIRTAGGLAWRAFSTVGLWSPRGACCRLSHCHRLFRYVRQNN